MCRALREPRLPGVHPADAEAPDGVHPRIIELYEEGETIAAALGRLGENGTFGEPATHGRVERAVLRLLRSGTA
ncbi:hypothetical protein AMK27_11585 [Streptomyces sp. CB02009]|nr:hypothetical protein AMK27_11585 [Streptomyces sp. CB02009]